VTPAVRRKTRARFVRRSAKLAAVPEEIPLAGGNVSDGVVRVGDTVRRPAGA
jgi:hypothetical protein